MKRIILILALASLLIVGCEMEDEEKDGQKESVIMMCEAAGGTWRQMPTACADSCESQRDRMVCAQVLTYGCDCGEGMCWNGESCETLEITEEDPEPDTYVMNLTKKKVIRPEEITIDKGDIIRFYNTEEEFYNNVVIIRAKVNIAEPEDIVVQSGNIDPGDQWAYKFDETGNFTIRDIYSDIRGEVTVR